MSDENLEDIKIIKGNQYDQLPKKLTALIERWLKEGKRYFGKAGVSLKNQLNDPKYKDFEIDRKLVSLGIEGEEKTSRILRQWIMDKPNVVLIDSISLPDESREVLEEEGGLDLGDTDHVLVIGDRIVIIDSKNWKSRASYKVNPDGSILRNKKAFPGNKPRMNQCKYLWSNYFKEYELSEIEAYICIADTSKKEKKPDEPASPFILRDRDFWMTGFKLVNQETLVYFLDRSYDRLYDEEKDFIRVDLIAKIMTGLTQEYNVVKEKWPEMYKAFN